MILKSSLFGVAFCLCWSHGVFGASYSRVYLQQGTNVIPLDYVNYGAPAFPVSGQLAQLSAAPVDSVVPLPQVSNFAPCVAPCYINTPSGPALGTARLVSYKTPKVPVAVPVPENDPTSYEYSYVVYDENTGDQKAQRELSDGVVVRGQYSLIQPDGYVREVQYTADDATGFNAVVKNFLPEDANKNIGDVDKKVSSPPCTEIKSEALKEQPKTDEPKQEEPKPEQPKNDEAPKEIIVVKTEEAPQVTEAPKSEAGETTQATVQDQPNGGKTLESITNDPDPAVKQSVFDSIIKCIQTAIQAGPNDGNSPLTLLLFPSKKC